MESLIYSNSIPFNLHRNSLRISRLHSPRKLAPPSFPSAESRRFSPLSAVLLRPYMISPEPIDECTVRNGAEDKSHFLTQKLSQQPKVLAMCEFLCFLIGFCFLSKCLWLKKLNASNSSSIMQIPYLSIWTSKFVGWIGTLTFFHMSSSLHLLGHPPDFCG